MLQVSIDVDGGVIVTVGGVIFSVITWAAVEEHPLVPVTVTI